MDGLKPEQAARPGILTVILGPRTGIRFHRVVSQPEGAEPVLGFSGSDFFHESIADFPARTLIPQRRPIGRLSRRLGCFLALDFSWPFGAGPLGGSLGRLERVLGAFEFFPADIAIELVFAKEQHRTVADEQVLGVFESGGRPVDHAVGLVHVIAGVERAVPDLELALQNEGVGGAEVFMRRRGIALEPAEQDRPAARLRAGPQYFHEGAFGIGLVRNPVHVYGPGQRIHEFAVEWGNILR